MSGEILTTIIGALSIFGFMYRQTALLSAETKEVRTEIKEVRADIAAVNERLSAEIAAVDKRLSAEIKEFRAEVHGEFKEVRGDIAAVDKRLSHTDGLVEGLSRALLSAQAPAQTQAHALA